MPATARAPPTVACAACLVCLASLGGRAYSWKEQPFNKVPGHDSLSVTKSPPHEQQSRAQRPAGLAHRPRTQGASPDSLPWYASTFALGLFASVLLYLAFPPVGWWPLAWVAPVPWLLLVRVEQLPSRKPYRWLYLAGLLHWLALVQWVRLGHWAAHFGWVALALYLAIYLPLFIWLTRTATRQFRVPLLLAAPTIWVGLEALRGWVLTGFSMALLGHTQIDWLPVVQISDLGGAYAVSFLVMLVAAALAEMIPLHWLFGETRQHERRYFRWWPLPVAGALLVASLAYGHWRMGQARPEAASAEPAQIALIQGSIDTDFGDPTLNKRMFDEYRKLTGEALRECDPDAIIWPESTLPFNLIELDRHADVQKGRWLPQDDAVFEKEIDEARRLFHAWAHALGHLPEDRRNVPLLLGASTLRLGDHAPQRLNSAVYVDERGRVAGAYHKLHPVMFGEYAPGGKLFPWIYRLMPIPEGLTPGERPVALEIAGLKMCPSICYENTVPHLIRRQVVELQDARIDPDVLVTLSNDGWFHGSAELDMHLICGQFRAIEMRKPALIAANTGISAHIADDGRLLEQGPRQDTAVVMAQVRPAWRSSLYARTGDLLANGCLLLGVLTAVGGVALSRRGRTANASQTDREAGKSAEST